MRRNISTGLSEKHKKKVDRALAAGGAIPIPVVLQASGHGFTPRRSEELPTLKARAVRKRRIFRGEEIDKLVS